MARIRIAAAAALAVLCGCPPASSALRGGRTSFVFLRRPARVGGTSSTSSLLTSDVNVDFEKRQPSQRSSILDDGRGHINGELATAVYEWEVSSGCLAAGEFSTRDGLRLVEGLAGEFHDGDAGGKGYSDLVQVRISSVCVL